MVLLTGFGLGCILIQILILMRDYWRYTVTRIYTALLAMAGLLLLIPHIDVHWRWIAWDLTTATPALFWWLCQKTFGRPPRWASAWTFIAFYSFLSPALSRKIGIDMAPEMSAHLWLWEIPRICEYLLVLKGVWVMLSTWKSDQEPARRRLRGWVIGIVGAGILGITLGLNMSFATELFIQVTVCICALVSAALMLGGRALVISDDSDALSLLEPGAGTNSDSDTGSGIQAKPAPQFHSVPPPEPSASNRDILAVRLQTLMAQGFYRTGGLTLRKLSIELDAPLHRLRALINEGMGYRNFSEYLNQLRIDEASARLLAEPDTPVLNIALDVGYRNISSFNRTFKDVVGSTPTEFRRRQSQGPQVRSAFGLGPA